MEDLLHGLTKDNCTHRIEKIKLAIHDKETTLEFYSQCNTSDKVVDRLTDLINEYKYILEKLEAFKIKNNL